MLKIPLKVTERIYEQHLYMQDTDFFLVDTCREENVPLENDSFLLAFIILECLKNLAYRTFCFLYSTNDLTANSSVFKNVLCVKKTVYRKLSSHFKKKQSYF